MDIESVVCIAAVSAICGASITLAVIRNKVKKPVKRMKLTTTQIANIPTQRKVRLVLPRDEAKAKWVENMLPIEVAPKTYTEFKEIWPLLCDMHYDPNYNYNIVDIETIIETTRSHINRSVTTSSNDCNKYFTELSAIVEDLCPKLESFYDKVEAKWEYLNKDKFPGLERALEAMQEFVIRTHEKNIETKLVIFEIPYKEGKLFDVLHVELLEEAVITYGTVFEKIDAVNEVYKLLKDAKTAYIRYDLSKRAEYAMKLEISKFEEFIASQGDMLLLIQQAHLQDET